MTDEDFKKFCEQTGRDWRQYANVHLFLEFADWVQEQRKGEKMPTFEERPSFKKWWMDVGIYHLPNVGEPPEHATIAEVAWDAALRSAPPAASEERGLREAAEKLLPLLWEANFDDKVESEFEKAVVALRDALRSGVTVDAPKGIPGWIKVEPNSPPPRTGQEEQD